MKKSMCMCPFACLVFQLEGFPLPLFLSSKGSLRKSMLSIVKHLSRSRRVDTACGLGNNESGLDTYTQIVKTMVTRMLSDKSDNCDTKRGSLKSQFVFWERQARRYTVYRGYMSNHVC